MSYIFLKLEACSLKAQKAQDPSAAGGWLFYAKLTEILWAISIRKSFALALKLGQRQPFLEINCPYVVISTK